MSRLLEVLRTALRPAPRRDMLPARVRERVHAQEERSEILVGVVQLAFIAGMALLYALSPKKFGAEPRSSKRLK